MNNILQWQANHSLSISLTTSPHENNLNYLKKSCLVYPSKANKLEHPFTFSWNFSWGTPRSVHRPQPIPSLQLVFVLGNVYFQTYSLLIGQWHMLSFTGAHWEQLGCSEAAWTALAVCCPGPSMLSLVHLLSLLHLLWRLAGTVWAFKDNLKWDQRQTDRKPPHKQKSELLSQITLQAVLISLLSTISWL